MELQSFHLVSIHLTHKWRNKSVPTAGIPQKRKPLQLSHCNQCWLFISPSLFVESPAGAYNTGCGKNGSYKQIRKEVETKAEKEIKGNSAPLCSIYINIEYVLSLRVCFFSSLMPHLSIVKKRNSAGWWLAGRGSCKKCSHMLLLQLSCSACVGSSTKSSALLLIRWLNLTCGIGLSSVPPSVCICVFICVSVCVIGEWCVISWKAGRTGTEERGGENTERGWKTLVVSIIMKLKS